jgi:hypothetical protein
MKKLLLLLTIVAFASITDARGGSFGGSRSSGSSSSRSSGSSFGGSRSSGSGSSSFGGSRSAPSAPSKSSGSTFGGSRGSSKPAPIVRKSSPPSSSSGSTTHVVNHHYYGGSPYYGYHPYYGYGYSGGFFHGFMWGQFFNRPQVIYVGGQQYVAGPNGQPMVGDDGQPMQYESHPFLTFLGILTWLLVIGLFIYLIYRFTRED